MTEPRASACPDLLTEDNRTPIVDGMKVYNYYDCKWGIVQFIPGPYGTESDGWFYHIDEQGGRTLLNGVRVSTREI